MEEKKRLCGYYNYTVVLTYLGMLVGFTGILLAVEGAYGQAVICLMTAGVCDMFDGAVAATRQRDDREKRFGMQIDSLSDLICFGVFPAVFVYRISGQTYLSFLAGSLYVLCALIRRAYFNVLEEERQREEGGRMQWYLGLPVTSAALAVPALYVAVDGWGGEMFFSALLILLAFLFLLPVKIRKPYLVGKIGIVFTGVVEFVILFIGLAMEV